MYTRHEDVLFSKTGPMGRTSSARICRRILRDNFEAHCKAGQDERRNIEKAVLEQMKTKLPNVRFKRDTNFPLREISVLTDDQALQSLAEVFGLHRQRTNEEKMAETKPSNPRSLPVQSQQAAHQRSNQNIIFPKIEANSFSVAPPNNTNSTTNNIFPTENDVVFKNGSIGMADGTNLIRKTLRKQSKNHSNATPHGKRKLEKATLKYIRKKLPLGRFLHFVPAKSGSEHQDCYRLMMSDDEILQAIAESYNARSERRKAKSIAKQHQRDKEIVAADEKVNTTPLVSPEPARTLATARLSETIPNGGENYGSINGSVQQPLNEPNASERQEPSADSNRAPSDQRCTFPEDDSSFSTKRQYNFEYLWRQHNATRPASQGQIVLTENDVVFFGNTGPFGNRAGTNHFRKILKEKSPAHRCIAATPMKKWELEQAVVTNIKNAIPCNSRFLRLVPAAASGFSYRWMSEHEAFQAIVESYYSINDVVFGKTGPIGSASGTNQLRKILKEDFAAYRKADQYGRRRIEEGVLQRLKQNPHTRCLQYFPPNGLLATEYHLFMSEHQALQAVAEIFGHMMKSQSDGKAKTALKTANSTPLLAQEIGTSSEGQKKVSMMPTSTSAPTQSSSSSGRQLTAQEQAIHEARRKRQCTLLTQVLLKRLEKEKPNLHRAAKATIQECAIRNKQKQPGYESVTNALMPRLKRLVGDEFWSMTQRVLQHHMAKHKGTDAIKQQQKKQQQQVQQRQAQQQLERQKQLQRQQQAQAQHAERQAQRRQQQQQQQQTTTPNLSRLQQEVSSRKTEIARTTPGSVAAAKGSSAQKKPVVAKPRNRGTSPAPASRKPGTPVTGTVPAVSFPGERAKAISDCQQPRKDSSHHMSSKIQEKLAHSNQDNSHLPSCSVVNDGTPTNTTHLVASPEPGCTLTTNKFSAHSNPPLAEESVTDDEHLLSTKRSTLMGSHKRASGSLLGLDFGQRRKDFQEIAFRRREEIRDAKKVNSKSLVSHDDQACQDSNETTNCSSNSIPHVAQDIDSSVGQHNEGSILKDKSNLQQPSSMGYHRTPRASLPDPVGAKLEPVEVFHEELKRRSTDTTTTGGTDSTSHQQEDSIVSLKEENEELKQEMEQMKMNHAMEIGALEGGSRGGDLSEKVTKLTEDLEGAHKKNAELATLRTCNRDLSTTNERLTNENVKLKQTNDKLERRIAALEHVLAEQKMLRQSVVDS